MPETLVLLAVVGTAFLATSFDNLLAVTGLLAVARRPGPVWLGHGLVALLVMGIAVAMSRIDRFFTPETVGFLGLVPLSMGLYGLYRLRRSGGQAQVATPRSSGGTLATMATLAPLSGDSLGVFVPLLAETPGGSTPVIVGGYLVFSALWAVLAWQLVARPSVQGTLARLTDRVMPVLLIAVGIYVLGDTPTDSLVRGLADPGP
jgi:cadmium resistance protein CadD (predicted permease)